MGNTSKKARLAERRPCPDCGVEYGRDTYTGRWRKRCDDCERKRLQEYRASRYDPEKNREKNAAWYQANKERHHAYMAEYRERRSDVALTARARRRGAEIVEEFTPEEIFKRDRWICRICKKPVTKGVKPPHPFAPTIDHIVDINKGGVHSRANVQTAHFRCNNEKP